ncbi:MAG: hypothetical protein HWQ44_30995 [Nostoc sp. JL34]|uniref:hypothetical protein n=1 Tax=Nostoc sp. JL34 TaxID=2815397 RepID=UPI001D64CFD7|nr:hypothetical protein [Nostoc sp. JL34]MBN3887225.1 hypothetical protein [Nostoc sp. JL34]
MAITNFGSPEVFVETEVDKPTPRNNEVLMKVYATSVNPADCGVRQGAKRLIHEYQRLNDKKSSVDIANC